LVDAAGKVILPPEQTAEIGLKVGARGLVTFMVVVAVQPLLLVNVIVLVPKLTAVTRPVFDTVATAALLEVHALFAAAVPVPVSWEVVFGQITVFPDKVGFGETVTVT
jgi:hypothetical protein